VKSEASSGVLEHGQLKILNLNTRAHVLGGCCIFAARLALSAGRPASIVGTVNEFGLLPAIEKAIFNGSMLKEYCMASMIQGSCLKALSQLTRVILQDERDRT